MPLPLPLCYSGSRRPTPSPRLAGARLVAPGLLAFELANVCLIKARRHPEQRSALMAAFRLHVRFGVEETAVNHEDVLQLAAVTGLTGYDASYLWLARELNAELITLDQPLAAAQAAIRPPPAMPPRPR